MSPMPQPEATAPGSDGTTGTRTPPMAQAPDPHPSARHPSAPQPSEPRHLADLTPMRRARALLATVPLVVVSALTLTVGIPTPAAATPVRRADRVKPHDGVKNTQCPGGQSRTEPSAPQSYTVVAGDTVSGIAARYGLSTAAVLALNGLSWKSLIFPGQTLVLTDRQEPAAPVAAAGAEQLTRHTVVAGDTVSGIAQAYGLRTQTVLSANGLDAASVIYPGETIVLPDTAAAAAQPAVSAPDPAPATSQAPAPAPDPDPAPDPTPGPAATITALTDDMRANAQTIIAVGRSEGVDDDGIVIALAAAMQESGLRNLQVGDKDSLGLFQQRPSTGWGTPEQILSPAFAARSFFGGAENPHPGLTKGLLDIPGWQSMTVAQAAQAVQLSAHPDAYGRWEASARAWLAELG